MHIPFNCYWFRRNDLQLWEYKRNFERIENRIIEVEIDEEILGLETQLEAINKSLTKLYKINQLKNERQERESLLTK